MALTHMGPCKLQDRGEHLQTLMTTSPFTLKLFIPAKGIRVDKVSTLKMGGKGHEEADILSSEDKQKEKKNHTFISEMNSESTIEVSM